VGKLCGRAAAELGLQNEQMRAVGGKLPAELGDRRVKRGRILGKVGEKRASLVAG
jgi:hypothetical protein